MKRVLCYGIKEGYEKLGASYAVNNIRGVYFTSPIVDDLDKVKVLTKKDVDVVVVYAQPESEEAKIAIEIQNTLTPKGIRVELIK